MLKKYLYIFLISMVPLIELRGAIPVSQGFQLPLLQSFLLEFLFREQVHGQEHLQQVFLIWDLRRV